MRARDFAPWMRIKPKDWDGRQLGHCWMQQKLDGWRLTLYHGNDVNYPTRQVFGRHDFDDKYSMYREIVSPVFQKMPYDSVLDGELCPVDPKVPAADVPRLMREERWDELQFVAFAAPVWDGRDRRHFDLGDMYHFVDRQGIQFAKPEWLQENTFDRLTLKKRARDSGFEGFVLKTSHYHGWWKVKPVQTIDLVVMGTIPGKGKHRNRHGALKCGLYQQRLPLKLSTGGTCFPLVEVASVGKGADDEWRDTPEKKLIGRVCEVSHEGWQARGRLKFSSFVRWRDDKSAEECVMP